jgi:hypothetical protein
LAKRLAFTVTPMEFEWDHEKNKANILKHGVDFIDAILIFETFVLSA